MAEVEASWTADQALIWVASRCLELVADASRRLGEDKLCWTDFLDGHPSLLIETKEAERALLSDLRCSRLRARIGSSYVEREWLLDAEWAYYLPNALLPSVFLKMKGERQFLGSSADGIGKFYGSPEEELRVMFDSAEVRAGYPGNGSYEPDSSNRGDGKLADESCESGSMRSKTEAEVKHARSTEPKIKASPQLIFARELVLLAYPELLPKKGEVKRNEVIQRVLKMKSAGEKRREPSADTIERALGWRS